MRSFLDRLYLGAGWTSAFIILGIAILISAQVLLNFSTRVLGLPLPSTIPSYSDFSGFMLAAATFLAMPYTFRSGGHIRVSLVTARLPARTQYMFEILGLTVATVIAGYACFYVFYLVYESVHFGDVSNGIIAIPLGIPQSFMALGMALLFVAILDSLIQTVVTGKAVIEQGDEI